jgi:hypothetical protein
MLENRSNSRRVYELVDSGQVDVYAVMEACLAKMGEEAVAEMLEKNDFFVIESIFDK